MEKMVQTTTQAIFVGNHSFLLEQHHLPMNMLDMKRIGTIPCPLSSLLIFGGYPLVNIQKAIENGHRNSGISHQKW
jgi:hypothetical protein